MLTLAPFFKPVRIIQQTISNMIMEAEDAAAASVSRALHVSPVHPAVLDTCVLPVVGHPELELRCLTSGYDRPSTSLAQS